MDTATLAPCLVVENDVSIRIEAKKKCCKKFKKKGKTQCKGCPKLRAITDQLFNNAACAN